MIAELDRRAREYFETEDGAPSPSIVDYVVAWIEDGGTLASLADAITTERMLEVSRAMLSRYVNGLEEESEPKGSERITRARARGAHGHVEVGLLNLTKATSEDASRLAERENRARQWIAERWNREELGKAPDTVVAISTHDLHLHALQRAPERPALAAPSPEPVSVATSALPTEDAQNVEVIHEPT